MVRNRFNIKCMGHSTSNLQNKSINYMYELK